MDWFERLTGFREPSATELRERLLLEGEFLHSTVNGRRMRCGRLQLASLAELRAELAALPVRPERTRVREVVSGVQQLHRDPAHAGALFQVASQFNLLEMVGPQVSPEAGVTIYAHDHTQGPNCAIAAGAGTIYRNYFVPVAGIAGQTRDRQLDALADLGAALGNSDERLWRMQNGYALPGAAGLAEVAARIDSATEAERDDWRARLRIGLQWDTEVTLADAGHLVSQAYCSALPVAYGGLPAADWTPFATLVLEAAYEATLAAACINAARSGQRTVFLTQLGGGAFGNRREWILDALERALALYASAGLDVVLVSYGQPNPAVAPLLTGDPDAMDPANARYSQYPE